MAKRILFIKKQSFGENMNDKKGFWILYQFSEKAAVEISEDWMIELLNEFLIWKKHYETTLSIREN